MKVVLTTAGIPDRKQILRYGDEQGVQRQRREEVAVDGPVGCGGCTPTTANVLTMGHQ